MRIPEERSGGFVGVPSAANLDPTGKEAPLVVLPRELGHLPPPPELVGERAHRLAKLLVAKARVPRFGILTRRALRAHLSSRELERELGAARDSPLDDEATRRALGEALARAVTIAQLPAPLEAALDSLLGAFTEEDLLAVRPSVVGEPAEVAATEPHLATALFVKGRADVEAALRRCFASTFSPVVLAARHEAGLDPLGAELAVVLQRMVRSEVSGACASADIESPDALRHAVIAATWGVGGGLSRSLGRSRAGHDQILVERPENAADGLSVSARVEIAASVKPVALRLVEAEGRGALEVPIEGTARERPALDAGQARLVVEEALRLEALFGRPVGLAFAFAGRLLYVLDVAPLRAPRRAVRGGHRRAFDLRLVPEGLVGTTTPLTYTAVRRIVERAARRTLLALGAKPAALEEKRGALEALFAHIDGHIYGDVGAARALLALVPEDGFARAVAQATGIEQLAADGPAPSKQKAGTVLRWCRRSAELEKTAVAAARTARERASSLRAAPLRELDADALCDRLDEVEAAAVDVASCAALCFAVAARLFDEALQLLRDGGIERAEAFLLELLAGEPHEGALAFCRRVEELVARAGERDVVRHLLLEEQPERALFDRLEGLSVARPFHALLDDTLRSFGERAFEALKIEGAPLGDRPAPLLALLRAFTGGECPTTDHLIETARGTRKKASYVLEQSLAKQRLGLRLRRGLVERAVAGIQRALGSATSSRLALEALVEACRDGVSALGERLFEEGLADHPSDVMWLTLEGLRGLVRGTSIDPNPRAIVGARKRNARFVSERVPLRLETEGVVATATRARAEDAGEPLPLLRGRAIAAGVGAGSPHVLPLPARGRDPAWSVPPPNSVVVVERLEPVLLPFLLGASAVVAERAGPLSSTAAALRSLGIPCVGGIEGALRLVRPGARALVDGGRGEVRLVETPAAADELSLLGPDEFARLAAPSDPELAALKK